VNTISVTESKIISFAEVRRLLGERFPQTALPRERFWETQWGALDEKEGGLPLGGVSEVCSGLACGRMFLDGVLETARRRSEWIGLVEGHTFDFSGSRSVGWEKLLVVRVQTPEQAVKAADLLVRDGNLPVVLLDLQATPLRSLGRIPASTWHRFQRLVEQSGTALVALTPQPIIEAARVRVVLQGRWTLSDLKRPRGELIAKIAVQVFRRGRQAQPTAEPFVRTA
jgi:hypothetical protein